MDINKQTPKKSIWKKITGKKGESEPIAVTANANQAEQPPAQTDANNSAPGSPENGQTEGWMEGEEYEGQLSVDVFQTATDIIIKSTIAGVKAEDIDISIQNDMITIRGQRSREEKIKDENYFYQECYWGGFSRSIILPVDVNTDKIDASLKNGVLTITLPKIRKAKTKVITVKVKKDI